MHEHSSGALKAKMGGWKEKENNMIHTVQII